MNIPALAFEHVEVHEDHPDENEQRLFIRGFCHSKGSATVTFVWQRLQGGQGSGKALQRKEVLDML